MTKQPEKLPCPCCKGSNVTFAGQNTYGRQIFYCRDCKRHFSESFGRFVMYVPKVRKKSKEAWKPRLRICIKCGKHFKPKFGSWGQKYCYNPCRPQKPYKNKVFCEVCGRYIWSNILIDSTERALCSFCIERERKERQAVREIKKNFKTAHKCKKCGNYAFLVRNTGLCRTCFSKLTNPHILEMKEVSE